MASVIISASSVDRWRLVPVTASAAFKVWPRLGSPGQTVMVAPLSSLALTRLEACG